jgi:predicted TIM-barrel fold metal-dependent hydrolase
MDEKGGRRKVLFGSNYPMILAEKALQDLDALGLDEATRELFLAGNAERVFKLTRASRAPRRGIPESRIVT